MENLKFKGNRNNNYSHDSGGVLPTQDYYHGMKKNLSGSELKMGFVVHWSLSDDSQSRLIDWNIVLSGSRDGPHLFEFEDKNHDFKRSGRNFWPTETNINIYLIITCIWKSYRT